MDHWLERTLTSDLTTDSALKNLDAALAPRTYLVGYDVTLADLAVFKALKGELGAMAGRWVHKMRAAIDNACS